MPVAQVQAPDGKTLSLEVPQGASEAQILAFAREAYQPDSPSSNSGGEKMDVRLPDGTLIKNVPKGTTKAQLLAKLELAQASPSGFPGISSAHASLDPQAAGNTATALGTAARRLSGEAGQQAVDALNPGEDPTGGTESPYWLNLVREGLQGVTLNASDELGALVAAGTATLVDGADFGETYADMVGLIQQEQNAFREENPKAALAAQVGGGLATGGGALAKVLAKAAAKHAGTRIALSGVTGAGGGATAGFLGGDTMDERVDQAKMGAAFGGLAGLAGGSAGVFFQRRSRIRQEITDAINAGSTDGKVAKFLINGSGKLKTDPVAKRAVKQGLDEGFVAIAKGATDSTRANMRRMVEIARRGTENARERALNRSTDVIGRSLQGRIRVVSLAKQRAGRMLDREASALKGKRADFSPAIDEFVSDLETMGVKIVRRNGVIRPDFRGADIEELAGAENIIKRVVHRLQKGGSDPRAAHTAKRFIDENVRYGKAQEGVTGNTERIIKKLRHNLDEILDENFPGYKEANDLYGEAKGALDAIQDVAGRKIDLQGKNADKALGTFTRAVMSNIRSRANVLNALDDLDRVANKHRTFDDDIASQLILADELEAITGTAARTSLQGETEKAVRQAVTQDKSGFVADQVVKGVHKVRGINQENALKALAELLAD